MAHSYRSTFNAPKPNTRFLKNIIKETNSHNAALQAKEIEESRVRLRDIHRNDGSSRPRGSNHGLEDETHHRSKRRRIDFEVEENRHVRRDHEARFSRRNRGEECRSNTSRHKRHDDGYSSEDDDEKEYDERRDRHHRSTHRQRDNNRLYEHNRRRRRRNRGHSRSRHRSRSPRSNRKYHHRHRTSHRSAGSSTPASPERNGSHSSVSRANGDQAARNPSANDDADRERRATSPDSDTDPLDAIIGPPPPPPPPKVLARGRGNFLSSSAMDTHFSTNYDPSVDVHPDPELEDDWDQALEAIRDRQRWQKLGAERLKSAGFTEEEVKKWETGGEKTEEDVRWKGRGEGREWDRGKVVGDDGVETRPEWGRLKGT